MTGRQNLENQNTTVANIEARLSFCEVYRAEMCDETATPAERRAARAKLAAIRLSMARAALSCGTTSIDTNTIAMDIAE